MDNPIRPGGVKQGDKSSDGRPLVVPCQCAPVPSVIRGLPEERGPRQEGSRGDCDVSKQPEIMTVLDRDSPAGSWDPVGDRYPRILPEPFEAKHLGIYTPDAIPSHFALFRSFYVTRDVCEMRWGPAAWRESDMVASSSSGGPFAVLRGGVSSPLAPRARVSKVDSAALPVPCLRIVPARRPCTQYGTSSLGDSVVLVTNAGPLTHAEREPPLPSIVPAPVSDDLRLLRRSSGDGSPCRGLECRWDGLDKPGDDRQ